MIQHFNKILTVALATTFVAIAPSPAATDAAGSANASSKLDALLGDPVIAKGKDVEIKQSELDAAMLPVRASLAQQGRNLAPAELRLIEREKLNELIGFELLLKKVGAADRAEGKARFEKFLERLKSANKLTDAELEEQLMAKLKLQGATRAEWDKQRIDQAAVGVVLERELKVNITDEDAKKYYEENPARFEKPEQVRVNHILIGTRDSLTGEDLPEEKKQAKLKKIEDLRKRAVAGEDFVELAKEFTDDTASKENGGEYTFGRGQMMPAFEAAAFSLNTNQISDVVTTPYGYHIIKLSEKFPAKMVAYDEVSGDLKEFLKGEELKKQLLEKDYLGTIIKEAGVEILDEDLKKVELPTRKEIAPGGLPN